MHIKSTILRSPHAFSCRDGGVSELAHTRSLNLAFGRGDDDEIVLKNLSLFADEVGFEAKTVISLPQIHSDKIFFVGKENCGEGYFKKDGVKSGDGYVTSERGVVLGIKTADCVQKSSLTAAALSEYRHQASFVKIEVDIVYNVYLV